MAIIPAPAGLPQDGWYFLAVFFATLLALILETFPPALTGLIGVLVATVLMLVPASAGVPATPSSSIGWALSSFSNRVVWLVFGALVYALGYEKSGLSKRLALILIKFFGRNTLGLGYAVAFADLSLAPFMSCVTSRSAGTIYPILTKIPSLFEKESPQAGAYVGRYIMWTAIATTCVTSSMFLTGLAPNALSLSIAENLASVHISWFDWWLAFLPAGLLLFFSVPLISYFLYSPKIKSSQLVADWARNELTSLGPMRKNEWIMLGLISFVILAVIFGGKYFTSTTIALSITILMVLFKVISFDDILSNKKAWNILIWFACLITLATGLKKTGVSIWFSYLLTDVFQGYSTQNLIILLTLSYFVLHYLFASVAAHTTALLPIFITIGLSIPGANMYVLSLMLALSLGLMGIISPYATGPSPIYYNSGYIKRRDYWWLGLSFGTIYILTHLLVSYNWIMNFLI